MKTISYESIIWRSNTALRLLLFFFETPNKEFYEREIQKKTYLSLGAVNKYLKLLAKEKFLFLKKYGRMNFFKLNRDNLVVKYLKIAYNLSKPLVEELKEVGKKFGIKMYLYGSVARGEDDENSDWDILVIGDIRANELEPDISRIRKKFNKNIKLSIFSRAEWLKMQKIDPAFYERVEKDKIELV
ncbi:MAG: nucleotidyltransferase domain-containing protein [Candidatus Aenigmatarchaeota archaeon]|nr:nucleotidyltransferase domain-containing protein [Candidatus Aenigmarchaeota archaeon]